MERKRKTTENQLPGKSYLDRLDFKDIIVFHVAEILGYNDLKNLALTSKYFHHYLKLRKELWKRKCNEYIFNLLKPLTSKLKQHDMNFIQKEVLKTIPFCYSSKILVLCSRRFSIVNKRPNNRLVPDLDFSCSYHRDPKISDEKTNYLFPFITLSFFSKVCVHLGIEEPETFLTYNLKFKYNRYEKVIPILSASESSEFLIQRMCEKLSFINKTKPN
jgi:hypothetical protein